ncbi:MAG: NAD(P)-dependent glycerol-3-phosphate dehydrogenase [Gammaproteobacteria bacterium]|nr:NAD(P)-dependent glycerol-3-phosphate dehydrogenase [Gammaproteobacteria bacterium]NNC69092.1 NAD(P)-dependent glycerol-3-phosphate dehydrogenase [Gammaproteobacteria bacterium]
MINAAVLGAGSWGTALAIQLANNGHQVRAWDHDEELISALNADNENKRYLPGNKFPTKLTAEHNLATAINHADFILSVVPSYAMRVVCEQLAALQHTNKFIWASKGFEKQTKMMMHQVVEDVLGKDIQSAVLSGPSFAKEVADSLPTAVTLASNDIGYAKELATYFHSDNFRVYVSDDVIGVELGGTVKNVLAIAAGIVDGLGFGANARAALVTRGLAEMIRLGVALKANPKTLMGLAGIGDLVLTCTDDQSRNRRLGLALAQGKKAQQYMDELGQAVEGFHAAQVIHEIAKDNGVEMPICEKVWKVLNGHLELNTAIAELLGRDMKEEFC